VFYLLGLKKKCEALKNLRPRAAGLLALPLGRASELIVIFHDLKMQGYVITDIFILTLILKQWLN
jgi:hypothetical protein